MVKRIIFDVVFFVSIFIFPWWVSIILSFIGIFSFKNFYEFIIINTIIYLLYSVPNNRIITSPLFFSSVIIFLFFIIEFIKSNIILYKNNEI
jgi:hypothetical protein